MIEVIEYKGEIYPAYQAQGFASKFCFPFAKEVCKGIGYDIGCNREEWKFPGAIGIDPALENCVCDAMNLPIGTVDYIISSHCLEHLNNYIDVLDYWQTKIKSGGTLFLYLPHKKQRYWQPHNNRKHMHSLSAKLIKQYLKDRGCWKNIFASKRDLNHSFIVIAEKI
jgi:hypothetical protein